MTPSERRRARQEQAQAQDERAAMSARYERERREGEPFWLWAMRDRNEQQTAYLDEVFAASCTAPNVIIRRSK